MLLGDSGLEHLEIIQSSSIQSTFIPYVMALTALLIDIICLIAFRVDGVVQSGVPPRVRDRCASWLRVLALCLDELCVVHTNTTLEEHLISLDILDEEVGILDRHPIFILAD